MVAAASAALGRDIWAEIGGCPRSPREAAGLYRRLGVTNFADAVTAVLGPPVGAGQAMRGDIAMIDGALGIVRGEWVECIDHMQPIERVRFVWRVER